MKAIELADMVEMIEEDVDDLFSVARKHIARAKGLKKIDPLNYL